MNILFAAYRDWAKKAYVTLWTKLSPNYCSIVTTPEELAREVGSKAWDAIVLIGWSWKVPAEIVNHEIVVGMHPSDLPMYAGGSPIQNQILDGVEMTKATLFRLNEQFDQGEIVDKEPIDLRGHLSDVFASIEKATVELVLRFVERFPDNTYTKQTGEKHVVRRLKPIDSKLPNPVVYHETEQPFTIPAVHIDKKITCKEMWDHIRCREDPYPNAYFEDETGTLIIKHVEFIPK